MIPEGSLPRSQQYVTCPYPEPDEANQVPLTQNDTENHRNTIRKKDGECRGALKVTE
jgi:hypothetical protein